MVVISVVFLFFLVVGLAPRASLASGVCLALLAATLWLNGALDKSSAAYVKTTVIRKAAITGSQKMGIHYYLTVSPWGADRGEKEFDDVDSLVFNRAAIGKSLTVELHSGYFGLQWYGKLLTE